ncbi:BRD4-interacting chromatin-remodeling complex-associated protein-like [Takifugu flavidus]|uniref:BRD4-interacting chromatin-remodeling complex-associated protein-like n=1 Tax=Takifugu flavidus TaxID=433684 RepID=A0A5C6PUE9_9TELE|nr:BRD4-interacting chromatin-remodeling complex-associated protein-like [Takifugu flavidus]
MSCSEHYPSDPCGDGEETPLTRHCFFMTPRRTNGSFPAARTSLGTVRGGVFSGRTGAPSGTNRSAVGRRAVSHPCRKHWVVNDLNPCVLLESSVMDDEDDRHLLDILGDVDALNDFLHGNTGKSIEEDDLANAAYGSDPGSFFASDTTISSVGLKDGSSSGGVFGEDSTEVGLQLPSSLSFIEDELGPGSSPGGVDLGGDDQPFDILQKSLLEADITEQTLAQEALLESQPAPTLVQAPAPFPSQLASGGYGGGVSVVTTAAAAAAAFPGGQLLQGVSPLPNGSAQHIQVLGSFGTGAGVMTLSSLERPSQIVLKPGAPVPAAGAPAAVQGFTPAQGPVGQVGLPFKNIPLQNIIIQRSPGGTQTLVRPIQPKPLQAGPQAVYSFGLHPSTTVSNVVNTVAPGGQYAANGSVLLHPPLEQQQVQPGVTPGQFLLAPPGAAHAASADSSTLVPAPGAVQIVAGQNFTAPQGQLILNQGVMAGNQVGGAVPQTWTGVSSTSSTPVQTSCAPARLTLVGQAVPASPVQRLLVTQNQNCTSLSSLPGAVKQEQDYRQNSSTGVFKQQLNNIHGTSPAPGRSCVAPVRARVVTMLLSPQASVQKRPAPQPLTKGGMILQQLQKDHVGVQAPDRRRFSSFDDALQRLLPYHVFQGPPPSQEFSLVDEEFEDVAAQVLNRTCAMVNKYRRLLMVEAEVGVSSPPRGALTGTRLTGTRLTGTRLTVRPSPQRSSPSSEMVMIERTFNTEERRKLTQDKRLVLVDPDSFLEDFCCGMKSKLFQDPPPPRSRSGCSFSPSEKSSVETAYRTDSAPGYGDPGGGGAAAPGAADDPPPSLTENRKVVEAKRPQQHYGPGGTSTNTHPQGNRSPVAAAEPTHYQGSSHHASFPPPLSSPPHPDTDSALEAAVNSILEC